MQHGRGRRQAPPPRGKASHQRPSKDRSPRSTQWPLQRFSIDPWLLHHDSRWVPEGTKLGSR